MKKWGFKFLVHVKLQSIVSETRLAQGLKACQKCAWSSSLPKAHLRLHGDNRAQVQSGLGVLPAMFRAARFPTSSST